MNTAHHIEPLLDSNPSGQAERYLSQANASYTVEDLARLYLAGATLQDVASLAECGHRKAREMLVSVGIRIRAHGKRLSTRTSSGRGMSGNIFVPLTDEELVGKYLNGASLDDLSIECRCSPGKIRRILTDAKVELRKRGGLSGKKRP